MTDSAPGAGAARFQASDTLPPELPGDPMPLARSWFDEAAAAKKQPNPNAMYLATVDADGAPSVRTVLCRAFDVSAGSVTWYTNYESRKARALDATGRAAASFHWDALDRQIHVEGPVVRSPDAESDAYFATRPWEKRLGAWASDQSRPLTSRDELFARIVEAAQRFGLDLDTLSKPGASISIPRPPHWGGYRMFAARIELWLGNPARAHDRAVWNRTLTRVDPHTFTGSAWSSTRLMP